MLNNLQFIELLVALNDVTKNFFNQINLSDIHPLLLPTYTNFIINFRNFQFIFSSIDFQSSFFLNYFDRIFNPLAHSFVR